MRFSKENNRKFEGLMMVGITRMVITDSKQSGKTVYLKSCDVIGRAKTKTNHIGREGLKTSEFFVEEKGSHIVMRH